MKRAPAAVAATVLALLAATVLAACGDDDSETATTPVACLEGADTYLRALAAAPEAVTLEGGVAISDCITPGQSGAQTANVGGAMIEAATDLNAEAQDDPGGDAAVQLGYLVGAVEEGASATGGIHEDLVLRINSAARTSGGGKSLPAEFERTFGEGYVAAREAG